jgi:hypothetical protein
MSAWSTAKRNGLSAVNIIQMGILDKYLKYGFGNNRVYSHSARLNLDNFDTSTPPPTRVLAPPTLQDLLNPVPLNPGESEVEEALLFNNPHPYGATQEDDDYEFPAVIRSSGFRRLAIEDFVNLEADTLLARLVPNTTTKKGSAKTPAAPKAPAKSAWTPKSTAWAKESDGRDN